MALIVEDGTGKADAESYCESAFADTYLAARGATTWATLTLDQKEQALRRATDYMVQVYRELWAGERMTEAQALDWPRANVPRRDVNVGWRSVLSYYAHDIVPLEVKGACAQLAFKAAAGELAPDVAPQRTRVKVGPIETEYAPFSSQITRYRAVELMLKPMLRPGSIGGAAVVRT